jgi:hypothetical protein
VIDFPQNSRLTAIKKFAFAASGIVRLTLPAGLESLDGSAFEDSDIHMVNIAPGNPHFEMRGEFLVGVRDQRLVRYFGTDSEVIVPREIAILGACCLSSCKNILSISFAEGSELKEIERDAMRETDLAFFRIPASVEKIHGSAFGDATTMEVTVDEANSHFRVDGDFLLDFDGRCLIRYFGRSSRVRIDDRIQVLGPGCFHSHPLLGHCDFGEGSQLRAVMEEAFMGCLVIEIRLPGGVRHIGRKAFTHLCRISIANLPPADSARFAEWNSQRPYTPSLVLDLPSDSATASGGSP